MLERDKTLTTEQKALAINLDKFKYGAIAEIGAGQEVARQFFRVGAAAGTIAKSMSAYDMQVSDDIYGQVGRYVSRERLQQMLEKEYTQVLERLQAVRPKNSTFFSYAATVTARSYGNRNESHGWVGVRLQLHPGAEPSDIILHVRMLDDENADQCEALGIFGINLIYGAFYYFNNPKWIIESLTDSIGFDRIEVDSIEFSGPYFEETENRLMNLHLIRSWLTRAVIFNAEGQVVIPGELFYKKNALLIRGSFKPVTTVNVNMMQAGMQQFLKVGGVSENQVVTLAEITMNTLVSGDKVDDADFLARVDLLTALGYTVIISDYVRFFRLRAYLRQFTQKQIGIVLSVRDFDYLFDEKYYEGLEGGILEAFGKLFPDNTHVYVYPSRQSNNSTESVAEDLITLANVDVPKHLQHLFAHVVESGKMIPIEEFDESLLHIDSRQVLAQLRKNTGDWQQAVPELVAEQITDRCLLGFDSE